MKQKIFQDFMVNESLDESWNLSEVQTQIKQ